MARRYLQFSTEQWDALSFWEQLMYLDGLKLEGVLTNEGSPEVAEPASQASRPKPPGGVTEYGPQKVDLSRTTHREVAVTKVNWGPPT